MKAYLFDIDGTLINTGGAGGGALMEAFSESFGVAEPQEVPFSGRTDRGIAQNLFRLHDVPDTPANWELLRDDYLRRLVEHLPQRRGEVLAGVPALLERLGSLEHAALGLLTGNARDGARLKLAHYELWHHFRFGGYGDWHVNRDAVAHSALSACREHIVEGIEPESIWVVGDTPLDIQCARAIGAKVIAVTTGWHTRQELADAQPDLLLDDLSDTDAFLERTLLDAA